MHQNLHFLRFFPPLPPLFKTCSEASVSERREVMLTKVAWPPKAGAGQECDQQQRHSCFLALLRTQGSREDRAAQAAVGSGGALGGLRGSAALAGEFCVCVRVSASAGQWMCPCQHHPVVQNPSWASALLLPVSISWHISDSPRASQQCPGEGVAPVPIPFLGRKPPCLRGYKSFPFQPQGVLASPCSVALALTFVI